MNENPEDRFPTYFGKSSRPGCLTRMDNKLKVALICLNKKINKKYKEELNCQEQALLGIFISQVDMRNVIRRLKNKSK